MKKFSLFAFLFLLICEGMSQNAAWSWAKLGTGDYSDHAQQVAVDLQGNLYTTGGFGSSIMTFPPINIPNSGATHTNDFFLAKYKPNGQIDWVTTAYGMDDDMGTAVTTDAAGNVYVTGTFESDTLIIGSYTLINSGSTDIFVAKYNSSGVVQWVSRHGANNAEWTYDISADAQGNVYLGGVFSSFGPSFGSFNVINSGQGDAFVVKYNTNGVVQYAEKIGGGDIDLLLAASLNAANEFVVTGAFKSPTLNISSTHQNQGDYDIFVATYDQNGAVSMVTAFGASGEDVAYGVTTDLQNNIYITGAFTSSTLVMGTFTLNNVTGRDMFVAKLSPTGAVLWAYRNDGNIFSDPNDIQADAFGNIYLMGSYGVQFPSITFGTTTYTNDFAQDTYLVRFDANGNITWSTMLSGSSHVVGEGIDTDKFGNVVIIGGFGGTMKAGTHQLVASNQGSSDLFVAKLCMLPNIPVTIPGVTVCPNSVAQISISIPPGLNANWYNAAVNGTLLGTGATFSTSTSLTAFLAFQDTIPGCGMNSITVPVEFSVHPAAMLAIMGASIVPSVTLTSGFSYHWYDCLYGGLVSEYSNQPFVPYQNGSYAIIIQIDNCVDTSACFSYNMSGLTEKGLPPVFRAYQGSEGMMIENARGECTVTDLLGRRITHVMTRDGSAQVAGLRPGVYFIHDERSKLKVIVQ